MDYKDLTKRYLEAQTSLQEEAQLKELHSESPQAEDRAIEAMIYLREQERSRVDNIPIRLHQPNRAWQLGVTLAAAVALIVGVFHLSQPTIYGYHNNKPITSLAQAELLTQELFDNLALANIDSEEITEELFRIE